MSQSRSGLDLCAGIILFMGILSCASVPVASQFTCNSINFPTVAAQTPESSPYTLVSSLQQGDQFTSGEAVQVILVPGPGSAVNTFSSVLIQARQPDDNTLVGSFGLPTGGVYENCDGSSVQATVSIDSVTNTPAFFEFQSSADLLGDVVVIVLVESVPGTYWRLRITLQNTIPFIPDPCVPNGCENNGACTPSADMLSFTCECLSFYAGDLCQARVLTFRSLANGIFDFQNNLGFTGAKTEFDYVITAVPANSLVDLYIGEGLELKIGNGNQPSSNSRTIIPGRAPVRIAGEEFYLRITVVDGALTQPYEFRAGIYQFAIPAPIAPQTSPQLPQNLLAFSGGFNMIQAVPAGSIVVVSGVDNADLRFGLGRVVGENEVLVPDQRNVRLGLYDGYVWFSMVGPVPTFAVEIVQCGFDPCAFDPCTNSFCVPDIFVCDDSNCGARIATPCAACSPTPCWNSGLCQFDTSSLWLFACQCPRMFFGDTCADGIVDLTAGGAFDLLGVPEFIPVWKNFCIHFTADANNQVRTLEVQGFDVRYGVGPIINSGEVDVGFAQSFQLTATENEFWACLDPNGAVQRFRLFVV